MTVLERTNLPSAPAPREVDRPGRYRPIAHAATALVASTILAQALAPLTLRDGLHWQHLPLVAVLTSAAAFTAIFTALDLAYRGRLRRLRGAHLLSGLAQAITWLIVWAVAIHGGHHAWAPGDALIVPGLVAGLVVQAVVLITYRGHLRTLGRIELAGALGLLVAFVALQP